jgi:hypothetical protein
MARDRRSRTSQRTRKARLSDPSPPMEASPGLVVEDELAQLEAGWDALLASTPLPR